MGSSEGQLVKELVSPQPALNDIGSSLFLVHLALDIRIVRLKRDNSISRYSSVSDVGIALVEYEE